MKNFYLFILIVPLIISCGAKKPTILNSSSNPVATSLDYEPFLDVREYSEDEEYGLVEDKPIKVGEKSVVNQRRYIASLAGPEGQVLSFYRVGSCCAYASQNGLGGTALVDVYSVTYDGLKKPIMLYISFYDFEPLKIPGGFTKREL